MGHPYYNGKALASLGYSIEDLVGTTTPEGDQPETLLDWAKWAAGTGAEYLTIKQREEAAKAEAEAAEAARRAILAQQAAQTGLVSADTRDDSAWIPWAIGGAVVIGIGLVLVFALR